MQLRNVAIIAHVDHGKTTLVDGMLKQTHTFRENQAEMSQTTILDKNELEREKGITILAKNTSVQYGDTKINIIDTPGHADFSGEIERVINMADGALLIVDAAEGPLPQTRFVLEQAMKQKLKLIVVINKIDRSDARVEEVIAETEDLFLQLAETDDALDFPIVYAVARDGKAWTEMPSSSDAEGSLSPLFEQIKITIPAPSIKPEAPFKMLVSTLDFDAFKGTYAIGKVTQGIVKPGQRIVQLSESTMIATATVAGVFTSEGLERVAVESSTPGDIIAITGLTEVSIGHTLADITVTEGYPLIHLTEPTLRMYVGPNTSPFAGRDGQPVTTRQLEDRLNRELKTNIGLRVQKNPGDKGFMLSGRGELHLSILLEQLRREGLEIEVGKPEVIDKIVDGMKSEPFEEVTIEVPKEYMGVIIEELGKRKALLESSITNSKDITRMIYTVASRNILGFRTEMMTKSRGTGLFNTRSLGYRPVTDHIQQLRNGVLVASETGSTTAYALESAQERGTIFVGAGVEVYGGVIIGLNGRQEDIDMNVAKGKKLTNMRASSADMMIILDTPLIMSLEQCIDFVADDELVEITPLNLRIRKKLLNKDERIKAAKHSN